MKIQPYIKKLNSSTEFKNFKEKFKDSFLMAGFFVIDFETNKNLHQVDYYVPSKKRIAAFTLDAQIHMQLLESISKKKPEKLEIKNTTDLDALHGILQDEMRNRNMSEEIKKLIAVIQNIDGKKVWNISCVLSGMEILKAHIEDETQSVLKMEKISASEIIKKMPVEAIHAIQQAQSQAQSQTQNNINISENKQEINPEVPIQTTQSPEKINIKEEQKAIQALKKEKIEFEKKSSKKK